MDMQRLPHQVWQEHLALRRLKRKRVRRMAPIAAMLTGRTGVYPVKVGGVAHSGSELPRGAWGNIDGGSPSFVRN